MGSILVGDDRQVADSLRDALRACGCELIAQFSGKPPALPDIDSRAVDFAVIDLHAPGCDSGVETAIELRSKYGIPPVFLTGEVIDAKRDELLLAAPLGYIAKPIKEAHVSLIVDLARRLLRNSPSVHEETPDGYIPLGHGFAYNQELRSLYLFGEPIDLTRGERALFELCLRREGTVVPYETIIERVWNGKAVAESTRRGLYHRLRRKLGGRLFETVSSIGCRIRLPADRYTQASG